MKWPQVSIGKLLWGGLGLTLFAKAATSLPIVPFNPTGPEPFVLVAGSTETEDDATPESDVPPIVPGLKQSGNVCEAPEEVMLALEEQRKLVKAQESELEARRSEIALAREKLDIEKEGLNALKASIEELLARVEAAKTDDLERLIAFYQNMKPADAARIMDDMDIETTIMVLGTMKPRVAAPILAKMSPVRTRAVSKIILERSQLPGDQDLRGVRID
ncbi:MotE family protein [Roseovarius indicus]|uniref:MotE family protein n=1 Tax=Roseovarius indicus TaxID=540747 RepID=UPI0032ED75CA